MANVNGAGRMPRNRLAPRTADAIPIPVPQEHGVDLPGGRLHRLVSESEPGFMAPAHLAALIDLAKRVAQLAAFDPSEFASARHTHPPPPRVEDSPVITRVVEDVRRLRRHLEALLPAVERVASRPVLDPRNVSMVGHTHDPVLVPHQHTDLEQRLVALTQTLNETVLRLEGTLAELLKRVALAEAEAAFARRVAEQAFDYRKALAEQHGKHGGGALHPAVDDRLAGFMSPEQKRRLDMLWDKVMGAP